MVGTLIPIYLSPRAAGEGDSGSGHGIKENGVAREGNKGQQHIQSATDRSVEHSRE